MSPKLPRGPIYLSLKQYSSVKGSNHPIKTKFWEATIIYYCWIWLIHQVYLLPYFLNMLLYVTVKIKICSKYYLLLLIVWNFNASFYCFKRERINVSIPQDADKLFPNEILLGASLVAQWLRVCLPMQGTRVRALGWEDPTCRGATGPVSHNCWACPSGACAPQREGPRRWGARAPRWRGAPALRNWRKPSHRTKTHKTQHSQK